MARHMRLGKLCSTQCRCKSTRAPSLVLALGIQQSGLVSLRVADLRAPHARDVGVVPRTQSQPGCPMSSPITCCVTTVQHGARPVPHVPMLRFSWQAKRFVWFAPATIPKRCGTCQCRRRMLLKRGGAHQRCCAPVRIRDGKADGCREAKTAWGLLGVCRVSMPWARQSNQRLRTSLGAVQAWHGLVLYWQVLGRYLGNLSQETHGKPRRRFWTARAQSLERSEHDLPLESKRSFERLLLQSREIPRTISGIVK